MSPKHVFIFCMPNLQKPLQLYFLCGCECTCTWRSENSLRWHPSAPFTSFSFGNSVFHWYRTWPSWSHLLWNKLQWLLCLPLPDADFTKFVPSYLIYGTRHGSANLHFKYSSGRCKQNSASSRPDWSTAWVPKQPGEIVIRWMNGWRMEIWGIEPKSPNWTVLSVTQLFCL